MTVYAPSRRAVLTLAGAAAVTAAAQLIPVAAEARPRRYRFIGKEVPEFSAPLVGGGTFTHESFAGKWSILDFWGLWCAPCMDDAPFVAELAKELAKDSGTGYIGMHTRKKYGKWGSVEAYFAEKGYSYPVALDPNTRVLEAFRLDGVPAYLIIGPDCVVRAIQNASFVALGREQAMKFLSLFVALRSGKLRESDDET